MGRYALDPHVRLERRREYQRRRWREDAAFRARKNAYYRNSEAEQTRQAAKRSTPEWKAYIADYKRRYRERKRAELREKDKAYRSRTRAQARETQRRWRAENREYSNSLAAARRRQMPTWTDRSAILAIYRQATQMRRETGLPYEVDHMVPLRGRRVSGLHVANNLAIVLREVNRAKSNAFQV